MGVSLPGTWRANLPDGAWQCQALAGGVLARRRLLGVRSDAGRDGGVMALAGRCHWPVMLCGSGVWLGRVRLGLDAAACRWRRLLVVLARSAALASGACGCASAVADLDRRGVLFLPRFYIAPVGRNGLARTVRRPAFGGKPVNTNSKRFGHNRASNSCRVMVYHGVCGRLPLQEQISVPRLIVIGCGSLACAVLLTARRVCLAWVGLWLDPASSSTVHLDRRALLDAVACDGVGLGSVRSNDPAGRLLALLRLSLLSCPVIHGANAAIHP
jgi:hypothetical protein